MNSLTALLNSFHEFFPKQICEISVCKEYKPIVSWQICNFTSVNRVSSSVFLSRFVKFVCNKYVYSLHSCGWHTRQGEKWNSRDTIISFSRIDWPGSPWPWGTRPSSWWVWWLWQPSARGLRKGWRSPTASHTTHTPMLSLPLRRPTA